MLSTWGMTHEILGLYHCVGSALAVVCAIMGIIVGKKYQKKSEDDLCRLLLIIGSVCLFVTIFQKVIKSIDFGYYDLSTIALQICHVAMYVFIVIGIIKKGVVRDALLNFSGLPVFIFSVFYFLKPSGALDDPIVFSSITSFLYHSILVGTSILVMISQKQYVKPALDRFFQGYLVTMMYVPIAILINELVYNFLPQYGGINIFGLSAHLPSYYPILNNFVDPTTSPFILYVLGFALGCLCSGFLVYLLIRLINIIVLKIERRHNRCS